MGNMASTNVLWVVLAAGCQVHTWSSTSSTGTGSQPQQSSSSSGDSYTQDLPSKPQSGPRTFDLSVVKNGQPLALSGGAQIPFQKAETFECRGMKMPYTTLPLAILQVAQPTKVLLAPKQDLLLADASGNKSCHVGNRDPQYGEPSDEVDLAPGKYAFYGIGSWGADVTLDATVVPLEQVVAGVWSDGPLPSIDLAYNGRNPALVPLGNTSRLLYGKFIAPSCGRPTQQLHAIADIVVKDAATFQFRSQEGSQVIVANKDGSCIKGKGKLAAGSYRAFIERRYDYKPGDKIDSTLVIESPDFPKTFAEAPTIKAVAPKTPIAFAVKIQSRTVVNGVCGGGAAPVAYLELDPKGEPLEVSLLATTYTGPKQSSRERRQSTDGLGVELEGPLDGKSYCRQVSSGSAQQWGKGRYALFVTGGDGEAWIAVRRNLAWGSSAPTEREKAYGDPLWRAKDRTGTDTLIGRVVFMHYPFYSQSSKIVEALFDDAPAELFVFTSRPFHGIEPGEPLLLASYSADDSTVIRANGERVTVDSNVLSMKRTGDITLPELAAVERAHDQDSLWEVASVRDRKFIAELGDAKNRVMNCMYDYRRKHDPTFGKDYDLVNTRTGATMGDVRYKQAEGACHMSGLDKKVDAAIARVQKTRLKEQKELPGKLAAKLK
jgi:hypothetical protein